MLDSIIRWSLSNKLLIGIFILVWIGFGIYSLTNIPIGAVPDVTNNQVQVITTSRNLATEDVEKYLTYPVELEMANLPGVKEIRSVSKFGLSVVTIVFEDDMGTYLPRQLIAERIKIAQERIPEGFGSPFMGPISTGLGEIYQYIIDVKPGYEDRYSITDLRTIQDWVVRRQLAGIPGVVEVNTWGGFLKQYEVSINPDRLRAMDLSIEEVFTALQKNNSVAGGGYIEKSNQSYFIRGEGLTNSLEDIGQIVVTTRAGVPVYIRDIAKVGFGAANRFGAITANGEGEKVLGQIMMLKGADSKRTIDLVRERIADIENSLPEGIYINGFLDRSELIGRTTFTIAENLILGCLIVIFVVVLLLGNLRSGLVVASIIPLSLLFALSLMFIFGVDANLMSLGAIDFGIIIDGAVIIVEYIAYRFTKSSEVLSGVTKSDRNSKRDEISFEGASKMMHSAIFGQIIIIIVFIPILSLSGVEGKMFRPMAEVFSFALIGAMILGLTYVPVASSLFLKSSVQGPKNISVRIIRSINKLYEPTLRWALDHGKAVLGVSFAMLVSAVLIFSSMGSEFVPTLDEGDFVIQPVLKTGTSLTSTVETITNMEKVLLEFPEVKQVVTRIGAAEIPTDPMSMEESDVIVTLHPPSEWTTVETKDELADKFKEALAVIPGLDFEFTQPIEMRFNELITGVRADLAIKIFGEDLDELLRLGEDVEAAIQNVDGAADIILEKVDGLPQMKIEYDRAKIAKYGLNISDLNGIVTMGFAGEAAGTVFEGERQFDLVVRFDEDYRKDIRGLENTTVKLADGHAIPFSELAKISYTKGPAKISRDNTQRRIVVSVNVRNRDLQSVVDDIQQIINQRVKLPEGYRVDYGGQFENLQQARSRLLIAVPVALVLIFILLYFAFSSSKDALMIYSAIPLSAIGGVLLLWIRDMPFSISAGVGFIALFGIAVLNGIVLIEHFKSLESKFSSIRDLVIHGAKERLRPVLLTASAAAMGFLPMAISTSAGAEVQRPLATVVVGGLVSATLLTLIVLPVLYMMFHKMSSPLKGASKTLSLFLIFGFFGVSSAFAQEKQALSLQGAIQLANEQNFDLQSSRKAIERSESLIGMGWNLDKTQISYGYDKNDIAENGIYNRVWRVQQQIEFPSVYGARTAILRAQTEQTNAEYLLKQREVERAVGIAYVQAYYWRESFRNLGYLDSLYGEFSRATSRRFELGESNLLEKLTAESKLQEVGLRLRAARQDYETSLISLQRLLNTEDSLILEEEEPNLTLLLEEDLPHPMQLWMEAQQKQASFAVKEARRVMLPDLNFELFRGTNPGPNAQIYPGFQAGVTVPLFFGSYKSKVKAASIYEEQLQLEASALSKSLETKKSQLEKQIQKAENVLTYYQEEGQQLAEQLAIQAVRSFQEGEIDFLQFVQLIENSRNIRIQYLESKLEYQLATLELIYLSI
ncbi:MAG: CusA/CzcA family heavy metal efflux RND transporter [Algoriphagus sp.]|uniref:CusA/CzcA family heavy metal efflux RND transporter n=1 Tax=Algoriphagus sp. TaxID=1872435 RepID=UPI0017EC4721|nr:CusA/CzcA family heavy metal efflux RND transporter [Algoriphagus sp.]NVJ85240.1 CusA/CzcA family heavy metal efflux RND transporter [Algoriphagus sp.]